MAGNIGKLDELVNEMDSLNPCVERNDIKKLISKYYEEGICVVKIALKPGIDPQEVIKEYCHFMNDYVKPRLEDGSFSIYCGIKATGILYDGTDKKALGSDPKVMEKGITITSMNTS